ncbi:MAG TPA: cytochrome o ubiquinol oxidase subunit III [Gammaproteobacteria bacterium]|jgi:cytochrome o ubiquinol oxidase subunit 3|nr:cytochrome o ubiquinol oxidase subunit III [Gammaproteobacteria bacterium]
MTDTTTHHHPQTDVMDVFGFWIYILSDCILFASIFATYAVLQHAYYDQPPLSQLTNLHAILIETMILLASSFSCGLAMLASYRQALKRVILWLGMTFLLGATFVGMELNEFFHLYQEGHGFQNSASLSAFYTLVGTHGLHVFFGLIWILVLILQLGLFKIEPMMKRRLTYFAIFWSFLDIIWIFVYTIVYLMGAAS